MNIGPIKISEARALAELGNIAVNADSGSMSSLLTDQERAELNRISEHYGEILSH